jgi:hypothetical protein
MVKRLTFCKKHPTKPSAGQCRQCKAEMCLECRVPVQEGVFCSDDCIAQFRNFRNAIIGSGPGRRRVTIAGLLRYAIIVAVLLVVIYAALFALTGETDPGAMLGRFWSMIRVILPF